MNKQGGNAKKSAIKNLDTKSLKEHFNVDGIIRIHSNEFRFLPSGKKGFYNFYLGDAKIEQGKRYLVVKIVKRGARLVDEPEIKPKLSLSGHFFVTCNRVKFGVSPESLVQDFYSNTFTNIKDVDDLLKVLGRRYKTSRPTLKNEDLSKCTITVSYLEMENRQL
jgi:hypothetical protein